MDVKIAGHRCPYSVDGVFGAKLKESDPATDRAQPPTA